MVEGDEQQAGQATATIMAALFTELHSNSALRADVLARCLGTAIAIDSLELEPLLERVRIAHAIALRSK